MNNLIEFAKHNRTTEFFRDKAIAEIKLAYRIMEYLAPDEIFPPNIDNDIKELLLRAKFHKALSRLVGDMDIDLGCSSASEKLASDAIELMRYLLPIYIDNCKNKKEKRRLELIAELKALDEEG